MEYQTGEVMILKDEEFLLMLGAAGVENWYGIDFDNAANPGDSEKSFNNNLASLYMKRIVEWKDEKARITEPYRQLFKVLRDANVCILVQTASTTGGIKGCYCDGRNVVTIEKRMTGASEIEISLQNVVEWIDDLNKSGYFPETAGEKGEQDIPSIDEDLVSRFELHSIPSGMLIETMDIYDCGLYGVIHIKSNILEKKELFSLEKTKKVLQDWCGGRA